MEKPSDLDPLQSSHTWWIFPTWIFLFWILSLAKDSNSFLYESFHRASHRQLEEDGHLWCKVLFFCNLIWEVISYHDTLVNRNKSGVAMVFILFFLVNLSFDLYIMHLEYSDLFLSLPSPVNIPFPYKSPFAWTHNFSDYLFTGSAEDWTFNHQLWAKEGLTGCYPHLLDYW